MQQSIPGDANIAPTNTNARIKPFRRLLFLSVFNIALFALLQFFLKSDALPEFPPRLFTFGMLASCFMGAASLWLIWRVKKTQNQAIPASSPAGERSDFEALTKAIIYYAIFEAAIFGVISLAFHISLTKLWLPYLEFLVPFLVGLPLIFHARRFRDRPRAYAVRVVIALSVLVLCQLGAFTLSGFFSWLIPGASIQEQVFTVIASVVIAAPAAYLAISRRSSAPRAPQ
jgi:hypothetical protein